MLHHMLLGLSGVAFRQWGAAQISGLQYVGSGMVRMWPAWSVQIEKIVLWKTFGCRAVHHPAALSLAGIGGVYLRGSTA